MTNAPVIFDWPALPPRPALGTVAIVRIAGGASRPTLRLDARRAVLATLHAWGYSEACLRESPTGPRIEGAPDLKLCLSYSHACAWIAFGHGIDVGLDATDIADHPEIPDVARLYLAHEAGDILMSDDIPTAFAAAWSRHEAELKLLGLPLNEAQGELPTPQQRHTLRHGDVAVSVACGRN